ncbi:MAG: hypothetical protein WA771_04255 [Chthoniobacterales bacterium]
MKSIVNSAATMMAVAAVGVSGCSNLTPGENSALAGGITGLAVGIPLAASGVSSNITVPVTLGAAALAAGGAYLYAKHQADQEQRRIAEARARLYLAERAKREREEAARRTASASSSSSSTSSTTKKAPKKEARYIAVDTEKRDGYQGEKAVMIYDTESERLVGNDVYDVKKPKVGQVAKYDSVQAEYVADGI